MPIQVALHHKTTYRYDPPAFLSPQLVRLRPAPHCRTPITSYSLAVDPDGATVHWQQDPFSNFLARMMFANAVDHFAIDVNLAAELIVINPFDFFLEPYAVRIPFRYDPWLEKSLRSFLEAEPPGPRLQALLASIDASGPTIEFLVSLNGRIQREIGYLVRWEAGVQTCEETLALASGSCRDSAWLLVQTFRNLGLAARFVSGYLIQLKNESIPEDFTNLHAWAEVYLPGAGWVGLDPTSGLFAGEGHIPLAATPEPESAAPVSGTVGICDVKFHHEMSITRI